jgi:hypothetical protein
MPKIAARNASLYIFDISGVCHSMSALTNSITLDYSAETPDVTGFGNNAKERLAGGITDWTLSFDGFWSSGANETDALLFSLIGASEATCMVFGPAGSTAGLIKYSASAVLSKYNTKYGTNDAATISATLDGRAGSLMRGTF